MTVIDVLLHIVVSWERLFLNGVVVGEEESTVLYVYSCNLSLTGSY